MSILPRYYDILPTDQLQSELDRHHEYGGLQSAWRYQHRKRVELVNEVVEKLALPSKSRCLDLGCGRGPITFELAKKGLEVIGLEIDAEELREAEIWREESKSLTSSFIHASAYELPMPRHSIDLVICSEVLEHLTNPSQALSEIRRVLKPGGFVFFTMPNLLGYPWAELGLFYALRRIWTGRKIETWEAAQHVRFPFWRIESLIKSGGFAPMARGGTVIMAPCPTIPNRLRKFIPNSWTLSLIDGVSRNISLFLDRVERRLRWHAPFIWFAGVYGILAVASPRQEK